MLGVIIVSGFFIILTLLSVVIGLTADKEMPKPIMRIINVLKTFFRMCQKFVDNRVRFIKKWHYDNFGKDGLPLIAKIFDQDEDYKILSKNLKKYYRNPNVWNIAITGSEGSGKSSLINHYEERNTLPFCRFLHISIGDCQINDTHKMTTENVESHLAKQILGEPQIPKVLIMGIFVIIGLGILLKFPGRWDFLIAEQYDVEKIKGVLFIVIDILLCTTLYIIVVKVMKNGNITLASLKAQIFPAVEGELKMQEQKEKTLDDNSKELIYAIKRIRRRISYTVVIDGMEQLDDDVCLQIFEKLKSLNKQLNNYILTSNPFKIGILRKPVRFLYVYRDELSNKIKNKKFFEESISLDDRITVDNVTSILEERLNKELKRGTYKKLSDSDEVFRFDAEYMSHIGGWLSESTKLNQIIKNYLVEWDRFTAKLGAYKPVDDDPKRLFSFVLYKYIFPEDKKRFKRRNSIALEAEKEEDFYMIEKEEDRRLLLYLFRDCPESYRITYLCMRFIDFKPSLLSDHVEKYKQAAEHGNYKLALEYIDKAICCEPANGNHYNKRADILEKLGQEEEALRDRETANRLCLETS